MQADLQAHKQKIYEEKVRFLININHELRTPLTLIYTPLNQLMKHYHKIIRYIQHSEVFLNSLNG